MPIKPKAFRKATSKVLKAAGGNVTVRKVTAAAYNTTTGTVGEATADTTIKGQVSNVVARQVDDLVKAGHATPHDIIVTKELSHILSGGDTDPTDTVSDDKILEWNDIE